MRIELGVGHRALTVGGRITAWLLSSLTGFDSTKQENMLLFECTKTTESKISQTCNIVTNGYFVQIGGVNTKVTPLTSI